MDEQPLNLSQCEKLSPERLVELISKSSGIVQVSFPLSSIGSAQDPADIADDYVRAGYFGETLAAHCSKAKVKIERAGHMTVCRFTMSIENTTGFAQDYHTLYSLTDDAPDFDLSDDLMHFEATLFKRKFRMPVLGDNYVANFINGTVYFENRRHWNKRFPTWKWGFWRSFYSRRIGAATYTSCDNEGAWIILAGRPKAEKALEKYGGFSSEGSRLFDALPIRVSRNTHMLVNSTTAVRVPTQTLERAVRCWERCLSPKNWRSESAPDTFSWLGQSEEYRDSPEERWRRLNEDAARDLEHRKSNWEHRLFFSWGMTEDGGAVCCGNDIVTCVAFLGSSERARPSQINSVLVELESGAALLQQQLGRNLDHRIDLNLLNPEKFEELCYDIILRCGHFDEKTARRHGRTKSRDGGRDIEIWSRPGLRKPAIKWIFQCKFIRTGKSLAASRVSISDVVDQYNASGFGVMTNESVDSTLYDKLDAIANRRCVSTDVWDGVHIRRFVAVRSDLLRRYFPDI